MHRRVLSLLATAALCAGAATPVERHGMLRASGASIVGADGLPVQIAGPSLYWSVWGGQNYYNRSVVDWIAKDWKASVVRAAMAVAVNQTNDKGYLYNASAQTALVKTVVDAAIANGIYVIVDWHDHDANIHVAEAKAFFAEMSKAYGGVPNVIWEIWNEPENKNGSGSGGADTWPDIRKYADSIIPVIRANSPNLIVIGTPNWSQDVQTAAMTPLADSNVAYTLHFYAGTHGASLRSKAATALKRNKALFVTEFGMTTSDGGQHATATNPTDNFRIYPESTKVWLDWADSCGISWANWSLSNKNEASAALLASTTGTTGGWSVEQLSESGKWIRARLIAKDSIDATRPLTIGRIRSGAPFRAFRSAEGVLFDAPADAHRALLRDAAGRTLLSRRVQSGRNVFAIGPGRGILFLTVEGASGTFTRMVPGL